MIDRGELSLVPDDTGRAAEEPAADVEMLDEVPDLEQRAVVRHASAGARARRAASQHAATCPSPSAGARTGRSTRHRSTMCRVIVDGA